MRHTFKIPQAMKTITSFILFAGLLMALPKAQAQVTPEPPQLEELEPLPPLPTPPPSAIEVPIAPPPPPPVPVADTTRLKLGSTRVIIIEEKNRTTIVEGDTIQAPKKKKKNRGDFGHWAGFDIGVNGFLTYDNQLDLPTEARFLELDYSRSLTFRLNFLEKRIRIIGDFVALTTGMGVQWNRYGLKNNYDVSFNKDSIFGVENTSVNYTKNLLKATYLQIPLMLDLNTSHNAKRSFHLSAGVIGGYKITSRLKTRFEDEGRTYKNKTKGHYQFNPFQAYATVQVGYGKFTLFANYGLTRIFEKNKGPQLYPFTIGVKVIDF